MQGILADGDPLREGRDDLLIDVCFYFIAPHRFTPMDKEFIRRLSEEATVAPICAKSDAMTDPERRAFQQHIRSELHACEWPLVLPASMQTFLHAVWLTSSICEVGVDLLKDPQGVCLMAMWSSEARCSFADLKQMALQSPKYSFASGSPETGPEAAAAQWCTPFKPVCNADKCMICSTSSVLLQPLGTIEEPSPWFPECLSGM